MLHLTEGSVSFSFTPQAARELKHEIAQLMESLKVASVKSQSGESRSSLQKTMEYRYTGDIFLEFFCNPNIWPNPFAAKVLITLRDDRIRLSTEAELTRIQEDIHQYLEQVE